MSALAVIPARYASTRFPGKVLARDTGKYLLQHVYERVAEAKSISEVVVATDDERVAEAVASFGGRWVMTRSDHESGTDRIAEAVEASGHDGNTAVEWIVNVQADEPEIEPSSIDLLVEMMQKSDGGVMGTLACSFADVGRSGMPSDPDDPNCVKVVVGGGRALYFSRSEIPYRRHNLDVDGGPYLHLGVYAYKRGFLQTFANLPATPLEKIEGLEQLRALEHGYEISVGIVEQAAVGIDTLEEYRAFVRRYGVG